KDMLQAFKERHDFVVEALNAIPDVECIESDGTFYAFPSFQKVIDRLGGIEDDLQLGEYLIENAGVALVPGSAFGTPGHMRLSFATSMENLQNAIQRIADCVAK
ncbi:MAG: aminotransferase class I/II-fold pyridoxal phosphate-dependent enzyme, partial [Gammaproteobacteria bacterium]|nr:aminotransferase class I/II-fold pyridoxal phosphate-dependent enzyme [Gammaproteobacteria bacterium]